MRYPPIRARNARRVSYIVRERAITGEVLEVRLVTVSNDACGVSNFIYSVPYTKAERRGRGGGVEALS